MGMTTYFFFGFLGAQYGKEQFPVAFTTASKRVENGAER